MNLDLASLIQSFRRFQLIYVALRLDLPRLLAAGPRKLDELALATAVPSGRLVRLIRGLLWAEILTATAEGFQLTEAARQLIDGSSDSLAEGFLFHGSFFYSSWGHLYDYFRSGDNPCEKAHGSDFFARIAASADLAALFNQAMTSHTSKYAEAFVALPEFAACQTVVDVGGGEGRLILDVLTAHPKLRGIVFDLPTTQEAAERLIGENHLGSRCRFVPGNMFSTIPPDGDVYILKSILHDWDNGKSVQILGNVANVMQPGARLILIERMMPDELEQSISMTTADLNMLCLNGGGERIEAEFASLLDSAGFTLTGVVQLENVFGFYALSCRLKTVAGPAA